MLEENKLHFWLYVLRLEQGKYYVGITTKSPKQRFNEHKHNIRAAAWTRKYKPIEIIHTKDLGLCTELRAQKYENRVTRKYINKYGLNNVRGGDIVNTEDYTKFFGNYYTRDNYDSLKTGLMMLGIIIVMTILYFIK